MKILQKLLTSLHFHSALLLKSLAIFSVVSLVSLGLSSCAKLVDPFEEYEEIFQIGPEWGRKPVTEETLEKMPPAFQRQAKATGKIALQRSKAGATAFYIGEFRGKHLMATNHHVTQVFEKCFLFGYLDPPELPCTVEFPLFPDKTPIKRKSKDSDASKDEKDKEEENLTYPNVAKVKTLFGEWSEIDFAIFEIYIENDALKSYLRDHAITLQPIRDIKRGTPLQTMGFGFHQNEDRVLKYASDSDCKVFSKSNDYRSIELSTEMVEYSVWSFVHGCDSSSGDSGSAILDAETGDFLGILTAGALPKPKRIMDRLFIDHLYNTSDERMWDMLSFATPVRRIYSHLKKVSNDTKVDAETKLSSISDEELFKKEFQEIRIDSANILQQWLEAERQSTP